MKTSNFLLIALLTFFSFQCTQKKTSENKKPIEGIFPNMGHLNHAVTTKSDEAQAFFNQGFTLIYGFNHEEAVRSFQQALKYDSNLAIAYWGIAFCYGSNYNWPADVHALHQAYENNKKAQELSANSSQQEKDYINTLAIRYPNDSTEDNVKYSQAMKALSEKYPDDLDAKCLYAESMMNLHPWDLWSKDGTPNENTLDIIAALESILAKDSLHIGANHYYIHATEMSPHPEKALACARRLATLVPNAGHLVHMPAHVYMRTGNYEGANKANAIAAKVDSTYIKANNIQGIYPMIYYTHNLHFLSIGCLFVGKNNEAEQKMSEAMQQVDPMMAEQVPLMQFITASPFQLWVGTEDWDGILQYPKPDSMLNFTTALWHWARAIANLEKGDMKAAAAEQKSFEAITKKIPADQPYGLGTVPAMIDVSSNILSAKMSEKKKDMKSAEEFYKKAVDAEKTVHYDEPPDWFLPTGNMLGAFYLRNGKYAEAEAAFRESLQMYPNNGRGLFGLSEALKAQNKTDEAQKVKSEFDVAWKNADKPLTVADL